MIAVLLPLFGVGMLAAPTTVATGNHEVVERALNHGVRAQIDAGWAVADLRTENDEFVVTLVQGDAIERHVMHFGDPDSYRIVPAAALPTEASEPDEATVRALGEPRGAIEVTAGCGDYYAVPYVIEDTATGEFAGGLVARTLATADDLASAYTFAGHATFVIEKNNRRLQLRVWMEPNGKVIEAELRRYEGEAVESVSYNRTRAMKSALKRARVIGIESAQGPPVLKTTRGAYAIDPDGNAFASDDNGDYEGCGC